MNASVRATHRPVLWDVVNEFDNIFENFLKPVKTREVPTAAIVPAVDIAESETAYELVADMPGVTHDALAVTIEEGVLTFGTHPSTATDEVTDDEEETESVSRVIRAERRAGNYSRTLRLADDVDESAVQASLKDGVLTLTLPKVPKALPRKIDVFVS